MSHMHNCVVPLFLNTYFRVFIIGTVGTLIQYLPSFGNLYMQIIICFGIFPKPMTKYPNF